MVSVHNRSAQMVYGISEPFWTPLRKPHSPLLARLWAYRWNARPGYPLRALWRSYVASFHLNLPHTNALIRRLQEDTELRSLCGFGNTLPHRSTFNRFIQRLSYHPDLVESALASVTNKLKEHLPDLGETVAVDGTTVRTHSNPNRRRKGISDPEASWTAKNAARAKEGGKEWHFGYKSHAVADVKYGVPLGQIVTTASRNDSPELPPVIEHTKSLHPWFRPKVVIADRGYDALSNHEYIVSQGAIPIIHIRKLAKGEIYTKEGTPICVGNVPMEYVGSDPERGRLYRCRPDGCHLKGKLSGGSHHCADWVFEDPKADLRLFGVIRRDGPEWKEYYAPETGNRTGIQIHEGVSEAGAALHPRSAADSATRPDEHSGVPKRRLWLGSGPERESGCDGWSGRWRNLSQSENA